MDRQLRWKQEQACASAHRMISHASHFQQRSSPTWFQVALKSRSRQLKATSKLQKQAAKTILIGNLISTCIHSMCVEQSPSKQTKNVNVMVLSSASKIEFRRLQANLPGRLIALSSFAYETTTCNHHIYTHTTEDIVTLAGRD